MNMSSLSANPLQRIVTEKQAESVLEGVDSAVVPFSERLQSSRSLHSAPDRTQVEAFQQDQTEKKGPERVYRFQHQSRNMNTN